MKQDFILPDIGEGIVECEIVEWLVSEGDTIKEDQPVCDVMTDKALVQIPAVHNGVVSKLYYAKGEIAKVHAPLFEMEIAGGAAANEATPAAAKAQAATAPAQSGTSADASGSRSEDFILPDIGEGIVECEIVDWLVAEGDTIVEDQPVCDVMTDKALVQIPAKYSGVVSKLYYAKGDIAKVHSPLFAMQVSGEITAGASQAATAPAGAAQAESAGQNKAELAKPDNTTAVSSGKALASPAVRRLARELSIDLAKVQGSGDKGRVYKEDVKAFAEGTNKPAAAGKAKTQSDARTAAPVQGPAQSADRVEPIKGIKAAMARQMADSVATIPHFTYCEEIDLTELIALRLSLKDSYAKQGVKLTMMPFFMKALSLAIKDFPVMNSQPNSDCTELRYFSEHNIGVAVDSKVGLLVPNVKGCQAKSIVDIARDLGRLTDSAREGRVSPADLKGGTITISNIGAIGGTVATPIINKPEVAIVALGKVQNLPRFNAKGEVEARQLMQISWSGDHRIIDGGTIARFTNLWKQYLEQPTSMLVNMI
ncbi:MULTISPECIES: dihydrolipoyllysine-residue acetyltransferase [unclassified Arsukibacterium]|uniref:dihydrolipoyllysine-residue acetyltransferase n=1 Tax=unclassified Arsukibacterium TaxID=2635278 RepID=UPI000C36D418|nr:MULTISPECIES: dihydrolipoyllysine-residue acetyltransferase [unclassified Arsukibacterium]MBM33396.1 dihydrolipoamide acetyltransferase [Rheinheimera sp.]|tara:strand:- start:15996 stop:17609 length:1614 start_codon:yes stop_codon:yes gene_type:complete